VVREHEYGAVILKQPAKIQHPGKGGWDALSGRTYKSTIGVPENRTVSAKTASTQDAKSSKFAYLQSL